MQASDRDTQIARMETELWEMRARVRDLTDDEIERAIEEIQATIKRYRR